MPWTSPARRALAGALLCATSACAHEDPGKLRLAELNHTVEALRLQNAAYQKQVEELANRVYILDAEVDHGKSPAPAPRPAPELPRVTLHPASKSLPQPAAEAEPADEPEVEYSGDAAKSNARRPVLRLYGDEMPVLSVRAAEAPPAPAPRKLAVTGESATPAHAPALYKKALDALRAGHHAEAAAGFREFLRLYASHDFADNAQYWLGETFYDQKDYPAAVREFRRVIEKYPQGNKVPDALLKLGFCHLAIGSEQTGRQTLEQLVRSYPQHEAASRAAARLAELGHGEPIPERAPATASRSPRPAQEVP
jgi:tol-pal system protein YbgF